jgi:putative ABC transport system permease protein
MASNRLVTVLEGMAIAFDALRSNKVRAGLTILGIAIGVFVVVVMAAAVRGINQSVAKDFESAGPTTFFVSRYPISFEACDGSGETCKWLRNPPLRIPELRGIQALASVRAAGARLDFSAPVKYKDRSLSNTQVIGFTPNWTVIDGGGDIAVGRSFTESEEAGGAPVVVINDVMVDRLFTGSDPIDKEVLISGRPFRVIGVYHFEGSFLSGVDRPRAIVPLTTAKRRLNAWTDQIGLAVVPRATADRDEVVDDVTAYLRGLRGLRPSEESDFAIITQDKLFETYNKIFGMFFMVMIALSAVGLLVGGVGVVAIMMISVTERTREIGVRKALGATRATILLQFLIEAITLTAIGAAVGLFVGWLVSLGVRAATPVPASVPPWAILAALVASAVTGIAFGMFPAARAARLDPVEALRYE